jgi:subtilisin family serine protease
VDYVRAGASVLNLSAATGQPTTRVERALRDALDFAAGRWVIVVAAAANQGTLATLRKPSIMRSRGLPAIVRAGAGTAAGGALLCVGAGGG